MKAINNIKYMKKGYFIIIKNIRRFIMFYTDEEYAKMFNIFLNERKGNIIKLNYIDLDKKKQIVGNLIRAEINNGEDSSLVIINIALNNRYLNDNNEKKFTIRDLKYFSIKHLINFDFKKYDINSYIDIENINEIIKYIESFKLQSFETRKYILKNILNIKKYYKNKKIKLLLI
jgi:hypothetical protein